MATGDQKDFVARLWAALPPWFGDLASAPVIGGMLAGLASILVQAYALLTYARQLTRIATATDGWLDLASLDYFGNALPRKTNEQDAAFRKRILANLFAEKGTRPGMIRALKILTGSAPIIVEPWRPADVYCVGVSGVGMVPIGSFSLPAQAFISTTLPPGNGGGGIAGVGTNYGGVGCGYAAAADAASLASAVTFQDVYDTVNTVKAEGTTMWVEIAN